MIVNLHYTRRDGLLVLKKPDVFYSIRSSGNIHPHIQSGEGGKVCLGNFFDVMNTNGYSLLLDGYQEHVLMIDNLLSTYNPDSPYQSIDEILKNFMDELSFEMNSTYSVDNYSTYTFRSSKLNTSRTSYPLHDLIGEEYFRDYYAMMGSIGIREMVGDTITRLQNTEYSHDDDLDTLRNWESDLDSSYPALSFVDPDNYTDYDEDNDCNYLDEGSFETIISKWVEVLKPLLSSDETIQFNLPDLARVFPRQVSQPAPTQPVQFENAPF